MNKRENVLIVHNHYQIPGGEDTVVANEGKMLEENGYNVFFYFRNNIEINQMSIIQKLTLPFITIFNIRTYKEIKRLIKKHNISIVHVHNTLSLISPAVYYASLKCKVPVVQTVHNFRFICPAATFYRNGHICEECLTHGIWCAIRHNCYRNSKVQTIVCVITMIIHRMLHIYTKLNYICLSEFNKKKLLELKQIKPEKVFVKPNFVKNSSPFVPSSKRKNQFVFAGRLDKLKGIEILFKAWKIIGTSAPKLYVCGVGPMDKWCEKFILENNLNIIMLGFISSKKIYRLLSYSRAIILPTEWYEGFPVSIVEAFSVGTPALGSEIGNVGNIIVDGKTGYTFKHNSPEKLAESVLKLKEFPIDYHEVLKEYATKYTEKENLNELIHIYNSVKEKFYE